MGGASRSPRVFSSDTRATMPGRADTYAAAVRFAARHLLSLAAPPDFKTPAAFVTPVPVRNGPPFLGPPSRAVTPRKPSFTVPSDAGRIAACAGVVDPKPRKGGVNAKGTKTGSES